MNNYEVYKRFVNCAVTGVSTANPMQEFEGDMRENSGNIADYEMALTILEGFKLGPDRRVVFIQDKPGNIAVAEVGEHKYVVVFKTQYVTGYYVVDTKAERMGAQEYVRGLMFTLVSFFVDKIVSQDISTVVSYCNNLGEGDRVTEYLRIAKVSGVDVSTMDALLLNAAMDSDKDILHIVAETIRNDLS